jgi:feruloyl esterase
MRLTTNLAWVSLAPLLAGASAAALATGGGFGAAPALAAAAAPAPAAQSVPGCSIADIRAMTPANTTITAVEHLAAPVRHCRIDGYLTTTNPGPNRANFRLQLPDRDLWTKRFFFIGVGGSGGSVPTDSQVPGGNPLVKGFAVAGTDKGHQTDALDWSFMNDPAKALDNAHRGAHVTTVAAQAITRAYYAADTMFRYEAGCSGGGDMGMRAMQNYPLDYDGVLLGWIGGPFPDSRRDGTIRNYATMMREITREPGAWLSPAKRAFIDGEVLAACDGADGAKDELIWDTRQCRFDFSKLQCEGADGVNCLTRPEVTTVTNMVRDTSFPISNISSWAYMGNVPPPWNPSPSRENMQKTASGYVILNGWARTHLHQPDRDILRNPLTEAEIKQIEAAQAGAFQFPGGFWDLTGYHKTGGKAIFYVGIGDPAFPHVGMENWYKIWNEKYGQAWTGQLGRLYQVPGWGHCGGGSGPNDGTDVMLQALMNWVERGETPQGLEMHRGADRARRMFAADNGGTIGVEVDGAKGRSRDFLVCPYPLVSVFDPSKAGIPGAVYEAKNWSCRPKDT